MTIGQIIYNRRKQLGLTLEDVGNAVGVGKSTVKKWEDGYISNMKRDKIALLAKALDIPVEYLVGDDSNNEVNYEYYEIEEKLKFVGCKLGFYEEDAYLWIEFPDGSLEITEKDLSELNKSTNDFLKFKLMELRSERPKDFRKKNK